MKFIIGGEDGWSYLERLAYDGVIGLFYRDTLGGIIAFILFILVAIFAVIGIITVFKWLFFGRRKKEDPGKKWLRTGRMD